MLQLKKKKQWRGGRASSVTAWWLGFEFLLRLIFLTKSGQEIKGLFKIKMLQLM
jgi:hypothetical protein